jgi:kynurenine formamidase
MKNLILLFFALTILAGCSDKQPNNEFDPDLVMPKQIIDLSPVIGEDLALQKWGSVALNMMGFRGESKFIHVGIDTPAYVRNSYIEVFNHGGAHLDAPNHMEKGAMSVEDWDLKKLMGPVKIFDATGHSDNTEVSIEELKEMNLSKKDIFMFHVNYVPPQNDTDLPSYPYLSSEACEYLASIPVKAIATDALSIESFNGFSEGIEAGLTGYKNLIPNHHAILTNGIPLFETLENLSPILNKENVIFVGFPLKFKNGNGSPVRAVAFVY